MATPAAIGAVRAAATPAPRPTPRVALVGNPNTGKTTVFNRLCGTRAKTSNFPGTTTSARIGRALVGGDLLVDIIDLPGLYQLHLNAPESRIVRDVLAGEGVFARPDAILVVVDACNLTRNLVLAGELLASGVPIVVALNMIDLAQRRGLTLDARAMSTGLGCPVVPVIARRGIGLDDVRLALGAVLGPRSLRMAPALPLPEAGGDVNALTDWAERIVMMSAGTGSAIGSEADTLTERLDKTFTHPILGLAMFAIVMVGLFWALFSLAALPMDLIEATFAHLGQLVGRVVPPGLVHDLLADGVIGGIAGTVVFLPQICLLFFLISLLEDTGYLARAAFVMDRLLCRFGLPGHAFVPLLTSHACALPGIMSTRLIPDRKDRLATIMVAPFMSCSARLPVYVLLTSLLFVDQPIRAGLAFAACYLIGGFAALGTALLFRRTIVRGRARPMMLELPSYKTPSLLNATLAAKDQAWAFLKTAGTAIMAICIVMWWLSTFPRVPEPAAAAVLRSEAAATSDPLRSAALMDDADRLAARAAESGSFAGQMGRAIQPVFAPIGYDWQLTVGVLTSFLAREVFVSTMSILVGGQGDDVSDAGVIDRIRLAVRDDGTPLFTTATAASVLIFFVLAMQCLPTLAVTRRETGSIKWAALQLSYMSLLAYGCALVTYQTLRLAGIP